jgi:hypothetical protein
MKRLILPTLLILAAIGVLSSYTIVRIEPEGRPSAVRPTEWPDSPLPPRPPDPAKPRKLKSWVQFALGPTVRAEKPTVARQDAGTEESACDEHADATEPPTKGSRQLAVSDWMVTAEAAEDNLSTQIERHVSDWLAEVGIDRGWTPPAVLVKNLIAGKPDVESEARDYAPDGVMYRARVPLALSTAQRQAFLREYHRHLAGQRLGLLGGVLIFVLTCLATVVGYIRADEATKGYYTGRLRLVAAAAMGTAGVILYQWIRNG